MKWLELPSCLIDKVVEIVWLFVASIWVLHSETRLLASSKEVLFVIVVTLAATAVVTLEITNRPHFGSRGS